MAIVMLYQQMDYYTANKNVSGRYVNVWKLLIIK